MDEADAGRFALAFEAFLDRFRDAIPARSGPLRELVAAHLGHDPAELPSYTEQLPHSDLPNVQLAFDALTRDATGWRLVGLPAELEHYTDVSLASLASGRFHGPPVEPCAPEYVRVPVDVHATLPCLRLGVHLLHVDGAPVAAMVASGTRHGPQPGLTVEVLAADPSHADAFLQRLRALMHAHNVYRGKVLSFSFTEWGHFGITFHPLPAVRRDDVVLPDADLEAIERHTIGMSRHADALRAAKRHLKRGLLLYGPPGTGKTLSVMYLCGQLAGRTVLLLSGPGAGALGQAAAIARSLQPSMVVVEDVDLVAMERTRPGMDTNPLLFQLLNEMDGLDDDADVVFVLTTNRVELLEPALAARPGRIDQAVEIRLPDPDCRRRLLELYLRDVDHDVVGLDELVERTDGVTASFMKELVRRAVLLAAMGEGEGEGEAVPVRLTDAHLRDALDDLLLRSAPVLRASLGAVPGAADGAAPPPVVGGWFAYGPAGGA